MNRDLSISKVGESCVYENRNIRITATDRDTLLSVTNERGTKYVSLGASIRGKLLGWNEINNHIILFTKDTENHVDLIYRIDYVNGDFVMVRGKYPNPDDQSAYQLSVPLFSGNLGFSENSKIDSVVYAESEDIQKIYWVDGNNTLRFLNITASLDEVARWDADPTLFNCNKELNFGVSASIGKDNSGSNRPNGVIQYILTYYNKYGQETGYAWISDIVYLTPFGYGGDKDGTNSNKITITLTGLDSSFTNFKIYSVFRSSLNGEAVSALVADRSLAGVSSETQITIVDDGAHSVLEDTSRLMYLGNKEIVAGTITFKDQTLFLGDIVSVGNKEYSELVYLIKVWMHNNDGGKSTAVTFTYSTDTDSRKDISYPVDSGNYSYENQLKVTSSNILTFKGGENYRFALKFQRPDGSETDAFWIGDKVNTLYPYLNKNTGKIKRVIAQCTIPAAVMSYISSNTDFKTVRLMIAEATYSDRLVKAQGIVTPTMFNTWERYNGRIYSMPSWLTRVRNSNLPYRHFSSIEKSTSSYGEIQCGYWESEKIKAPYYRQYTNQDNKGEYVETFEGSGTFNFMMVEYTIWYWRGFDGANYKCEFNVVQITDCASGHELEAKTYPIPNFSSWPESMIDGKRWRTHSETYFNVRIYTKTFTGTSYNHGTARTNLYSAIKRHLVLDMSIPDLFVVPYSRFREWCEQTYLDPQGTKNYFNGNYKDSVGSFESMLAAMNFGSSSALRWSEGSELIGAGSQEAEPAYYKKHLMFVDENVVTLDSPEIAYNAITINDAGYKFRIVGVAKMTSVISDYVIDATAGHLPGASVNDYNLSSRFDDNKENEGLISFPLWRETGLETQGTPSSDVRKRTSADYKEGTDIVHYWIYLWQHSGNITEFECPDHANYNILRKKTFANLHFGYNTIYLNNCVSVNGSDVVSSLVDIDTDELYSIPKGSEQYNLIQSRNYDNDIVYRNYIGSGRLQLSMPGSLKYPIALSDSRPASIGKVTPDTPYLYSQSPVTIEYRSASHALLNFRTRVINSVYTQTILPAFLSSDVVNIETGIANQTDAIIPWIESSKNIRNTLYIDYDGVTFSPLFTLSEDGEYLCYINGAIAPSMYAMRYSIAEGFAASDSDDVYMRVATDTHYYFVNLKNYTYEYVSGNGKISIPTSDIVYQIVSTDEDMTVLIDEIAVSYDSSHNTSSASVIGFKDLSLKNNTLSSDSVTNNGLISYAVNQQSLSFVPNSLSADTLRDNDRYVLIGEIYKDATGAEYGGVSDSAVLNNRFVNAGDAYELSGTSDFVVYGNQGDTYFQRFDSMRVMPYGEDSENGVVDIASVMLETHINIDGRTDRYRLAKEIASFDTSKYGNINEVYSQHNNFITSRQSSSDIPDAYRSYITWSLPKGDLSDVDEWTHMTLASSLKLDSDKGSCIALRRFGNSILAFQEKGISEILYNSRTQLSTEQGVPVELSNSGKVDGKRYITNKYGCSDKQSIVEGKSAIYFVDSINKAFCSFNGEVVDRLSTRLGFDVWFREHVSSGIKTFYDGRYSDVYMVKSGDNECPCLAFSETLGVFTSFYDYNNVEAMFNVGDKFVSLKGGLWINNEGSYCKFFGQQKPFWIQYRVTPDPYGDKIWTNLEYRADFSRVLSGGDSSVPAEPSVDYNSVFAYKENETFNHIRFWNEYQTTSMEGNHSPIRKFRTWRLAIPRAIADEGNNQLGLDRIRNPWVNILLKKTYSGHSDPQNQDVMQLHDVTVYYFE